MDNKRQKSWQPARSVRSKEEEEEGEETNKQKIKNTEEEEITIKGLPTKEMETPAKTSDKDKLLEKVSKYTQ